MSADRATVYDPSIPKEMSRAVFGKGKASGNPVTRIGLTPVCSVMDAISFRRNDNDRRPPREIVTGKLLGDPKPNHFEQAEAIRRRIMAKVIVLEPVSVALLLRALLVKPMGATEVSAMLGCSPSGASDRAKRARAMGYLEMREQRTARGRLTTYRITDSGRKFLESLT